MALGDGRSTQGPKNGFGRLALHLARESERTVGVHRGGRMGDATGYIQITARSSSCM